MSERCPGSEVPVDTDELLQPPDFVFNARALCIVCAGRCDLFHDGTTWRKSVHNRPIFAVEDFHEDSPECRAYNCSRLVKHDGDLCSFHLSEPDYEDEDISNRRVARARDKAWDRYLDQLSEYDPGSPSETERLWHPEGEQA